jgi:hypothetical protein
MGRSKWARTCPQLNGLPEFPVQICKCADAVATAFRTARPGVLAIGERRRAESALGFDRRQVQGFDVLETLSAARRSRSSSCTALRWPPLIHHPWLDPACLRYQSGGRWALALAKVGYRRDLRLIWPLRAALFVVAAAQGDAAASAGRGRSDRPAAINEICLAACIGTPIARG